MNAHWSDSDSIELLRISINNYPKFVYFKTNNEPDKFFDDRCFCKFHNLGRNGKSIKNRIETIQKKFRKIIRNLNIDKFKEGIIEGDIYNNNEAKDLFNTSFEFERLYGKHCGSKELMKIIEMVCHSNYWTKNRRRIHPRWNKRPYDGQESTEENFTPIKQTQLNSQSQIIISSTETSPSQSDDLAPFRDADYIDRTMHRHNSHPSVSTRKVNGSKLSKFRSISESSNIYIINHSTEQIIKGITLATQTDELIRRVEVSSVMTETNTVTAVDRDTSTTRPRPRMDFTVSDLISVDIPPSEVDDRAILSKYVASISGTMSDDIASIKDSLLDISHSMKQLVQVLTKRAG